MQTRATEHAGAVGAEDAVDPFPVAVELRTELPEQRDPVIERTRLVMRPRHPRLELCKAGRHGVAEQRGVGRIPAAEQQAFGLDAVRSAGHGGQC